MRLESTIKVCGLSRQTTRLKNRYGLSGRRIKIEVKKSRRTRRRSPTNWVNAHDDQVFFWITGYNKIKATGM